jgi:Zn-dependent peptidase ImmA (M78 family)
MTIKIERMNLDEAGGDPAKIAKAVLAQIPGLAPPVPIEEIAYGADIREIQRLDLTGYEGGLISWDDKFEGIVLVNRRSGRERQRYTIGHELGHFLNPWHEPPNEEGFRCTVRDMVRSEADSGDRVARMEVEANVFAAELLFPRRLFLADLRRRAGLDLEQILELAARYDMSKEATARRYVALHDEPCAVVFSHNGLIRYWRKNKDFPFIEARAGQAVPTGALAARHEGPRGMVSDWV